MIELEDHIYLFEFKLDQDAATAIKQIEDHQYYRKYQLRDKAVSYIGANFDAKKRMVDDWDVKRL